MRKFLIFCSVLFPLVSSADWWITTVGGGGGGGTSIALDSSGCPHIAYFHGMKDDAQRYASLNPDSTWTIEYIGGGYGNPCITIDSKNYPHIIYIYQRYSYKDSSGWHTKLISFPEVIGWDEGKISMDLDSKDYPHILGSNSVWMPSKGLYHFWKDSLDWHYDTVDNIASCQYGSAIVIDDEDSIHISYPGQEGLIYARKRESGWYKEVIDNAGISMSMALNSLWQPCIAYRDNGKLKYARKDSIGWEITVVDSENIPISYPSLALDLDNYPRICYICNNKDIKYAWWDGSSWNFTILDYNIEVSGYLDITVDNENYSHLTYQHWNEKITKYAKGHGFVGVEERRETRDKRQKTKDKRRETRLDVYPNPFVKQTVIRNSEIGNRNNLKIEIYDLSGRLIKERFFATAQNDKGGQNDKLEIGKELQSGIYFVRAKGYRPIKIIKLR